MSNGSSHLGTFEPTRWSLVLRARGDDGSIRQEALQSLSQTYWFPLYTFLRRSGRSVEDAQDLTQEFFIRLLDGRLLDIATPEKGRFRTLLLAGLKQVDIDDWRSSHAQKRGGHTTLISIDTLHAEEKILADNRPENSPENAFDRAWATALMDRTWALLRETYATPEQAALFAELAPRLSSGDTGGTLAEVGHRLDMSEVAVKKALSRMRQRFGDTLRKEVEQTTGSREAARQEMSHLLSLFP